MPKSSRDLVIAGILLAGIPVLLLIIMLITHLVLRCSKQEKQHGSKPDDVHATESSVAVSIAGDLVRP